MLHMQPDLQAQTESQSDVFVLVVGASRGIGLALVEALLKQPEQLISESSPASASRLVIFAACRQPEQAHALLALQQHFPQRLLLIALDMTLPESLQALTQHIRRVTPTLRAVINTVGVLHESASELGPALRPEKALTQISVQSLARSFAVNAWAAILLAQAVSPLIHRQQAFTFASLSARVGSIGDNHLGGWYSYRAAKAAHNQLLKTWSIELARSHPLATVLILHPGTTDTDLSKPFSAQVAPDKLFTSARVARDLLAVMQARGPADSGGFFDWANIAVPW